MASHFRDQWDKKVYMYICIHACMYRCMYICMYACVCVFIHVRTSNAGKTYSKSVSHIYACFFSHVMSVQCLFHSSKHTMMRMLHAQTRGKIYAPHCSLCWQEICVMKPKCSFCYSEQSTSCPYPQPRANSWAILTQFLDPLLILCSHLRLSTISHVELSGSLISHFCV
jgi:hypothetical protein